MGCDNDPLTREQVAVVYEMLDGQMSENALEASSSSHLDSSTSSAAIGLPNSREFSGRTQSTASGTPGELRNVCRWVGGMIGYENRYPVTIDPSRPAFPLFKIVGIDPRSAVPELGVFRYFRSVDDVGYFGDFVTNARTWEPLTMTATITPLRDKQSESYLLIERWLNGSL